MIKLRCLDKNSKHLINLMKQQLTEDLFQAYYDARRNKRNKKDVIEFEMNY